jgi:cytidylate kinase
MSLNHLRAPTRHLVLVGLPGAGKSSVARMLAECTDTQIVEVGRFVIAEASTLNSRITPLELAERTFMQQDFHRFVRQAAQQVRRVEGYSIVVGPRLPVELSYLRLQFNEILALGISASDEIRISRRLRQLGAGSRVDMQENLRSRDSVERSWGIEETLSLCDVVINGEQDLHAVVGAVRTLWLMEK